MNKHWVAAALLLAGYLATAAATSSVRNDRHALRLALDGISDRYFVAPQCQEDFTYPFSNPNMKYCYCPLFTELDFPTWGCGNTTLPAFLPPPANDSASLGNFLVNYLLKPNQFMVHGAQLLGQRYRGAVVDYAGTCHYLAQKADYDLAVVLTNGDRETVRTMSNGRLPGEVFNVETGTTNDPVDRWVFSGIAAAKECTGLTFNLSLLVNTTVLVSLDYVMGSEEYPEFVFSPFNDQFRFFVREAGTTTWAANLAKTPNNVDIEIDTVNYQVNAALYENCPKFGGYDGYTKNLLARSYQMQPGKVYEFMMVVCDLDTESNTESDDYYYDTAVHMKAYSFGICENQYEVTCPQDKFSCGIQGQTKTFTWSDALPQEACGPVTGNATASIPGNSFTMTYPAPFTTTTQTVTYTYKTESCSFDLEVEGVSTSCSGGGSVCSGGDYAVWTPPDNPFDFSGRCDYLDYSVQCISNCTDVWPLPTQPGAVAQYSVTYKITGTTVTCSIPLQVRRNQGPVIENVTLSGSGVVVDANYGKLVDNVPPGGDNITDGIQYTVVSGSIVDLSVRVADDFCNCTSGSVHVFWDLFSTDANYLKSSLSQASNATFTSSGYTVVFQNQQLVNQGSVKVVTIMVTDCFGEATLFYVYISFAAPVVTCNPPLPHPCNPNQVLVVDPITGKCTCKKPCARDSDCVEPVSGTCSNQCIRSPDNINSYCDTTNCPRTCCKATPGRIPGFLDEAICSNGCGQNSCCFVTPNPKSRTTCNSMPMGDKNGNGVTDLVENCSVLYGRQGSMPYLCSDTTPCTTYGFPSNHPCIPVDVGKWRGKVCSIQCGPGSPTNYQCKPLTETCALFYDDTNSIGGTGQKWYFCVPNGFLG